MCRPVRDLHLLLCSLRPERHPGAFAFVSVDPGADLSGCTVLATFREEERP